SRAISTTRTSRDLPLRSAMRVATGMVVRAAKLAPLGKWTPEMSLGLHVSGRVSPIAPPATPRHVIARREGPSGAAGAVAIARHRPPLPRLAWAATQDRVVSHSFLGLKMRVSVAP